eukprot:6172526-Pleurochrysis_carterae.AAC.2
MHIQSGRCVGEKATCARLLEGSRDYLGWVGNSRMTVYSSAPCFKRCCETLQTHRCKSLRGAASMRIRIMLSDLDVIGCVESAAAAGCLAHACHAGSRPFASRDQALQFSEFATELRPKPPASALPLLGACMFDNYTRRVLYKSQKTSEDGGFLLHMTNSCSMHVPALLSPLKFNADALCKLGQQWHLVFCPAAWGCAA